MTREEAIQELQNCKEFIQQDGQDYYYLDERDIPLLDMAIEALHREEAEAKGWCHRLIPKGGNEQHNVDHDRDWIIGCLEHDGFIHTHRFDKANQIILEALQNEQRWIPCSEKLPKDDESFYVLCCDKYGEIIIAHVFECDEGETPYSAESENEYMYDCVAWMPLPEPYKGGDDE